MRTNFRTETSADGNVTVSTLTVTPSTIDSGSLLVCRAGNPSKLIKHVICRPRNYSLVLNTSQGTLIQDTLKISPRESFSIPWCLRENPVLKLPLFPLFFPGIPDSTMEDSWKLEIHYIPSSTLILGSNLNATNIKEGDDVYFDCKVQASPAPYKITWKHNVS